MRTRMVYGQFMYCDRLVGMLVRTHAIDTHALSRARRRGVDTRVAISGPTAISDN